MNRNRCLTLFLALSLYAWTSSAFAVVSSYYAIMDGPSESPANASPGTGFGLVNYDSVAHTLAVHVDFSGLTGTTTASHIHAPTLVPFTSTAGVATTTPTFAGFPLGVTSGSYTNVLDLTLASSYNPAFVSANGGTTASAEIALTSSFATGQAYWNIHSSTFGGGEIRGFLIAIPEPTSCVLIALGMAGFGCVSRRRRA
jgi:CHRD domain